MKVVTLIGTFHEERGRVCSSELTDILGEIRPEIIFLEAPSSLRGGLAEISETKPVEAGAVLQYLNEYSAKIVHVDLPISPDSYLRNPREVLSYVDRVSTEYGRLVDQNRDSMTAEGFSYLNSDRYERIMRDIQCEILRILALRDSQTLNQAYESWRRDDELRENEMVSRIEKYGEMSAFDRAVFLVGASHRASIVEKSKTNALSSLAHVQWDFSQGWYAKQ